MTRRRALVGLALLAVLAVLGGMMVVQGAHTNPVVATITVGPNPGADAGQIAVDAQTGRAFVTAPSLPGLIGKTVSVLDTSAGTLLRTVAVGANPTGVAVDTRSGHVFVGNADDGTVSMLDARSGVVLRTIAVGGPLGVMAVDATTARLFVPNPGKGTVSVLNTRSGALDATINVGGSRSRRRWTWRAGTSSSPMAMVMWPCSIPVVAPSGGPSG